MAVIEGRYSERTTITREEAERRIANVLKVAGIKATILSCNCCTVFDAEFPDGDIMETDAGIDIECDGISHRRG
jgi:hypothetical protein